MKYSTVKITAVIAAFLFIFGFVPGRLPAANYDTAVNLYESGDLDRAYDEFRSHLAENPEDARSLNYLWRICEEEGRSEEAFKYAVQLADRSPESFEYFEPLQVYRSVGMLAYEIQEYRRALSYFERAKKVASDTDTRENLTGWLQRARSAHLRQKRLDRESVIDSIINEARHLAESSGLEAAIDFLEEKRQSYDSSSRIEKTLDVFEKNKEFKNWAARVKETEADSPAGRIKNLLSAGEEYLEKEQFRDTATAHLAKLYYFRGTRLVDSDPGQSREFLLRARALAGQPRPEIFHEVARSYYASGEYARAAEFLQKLRRRFPDFEVGSSLAWSVWFWTSLDRIVLGVLLVGLVAGIFFVFVPVFGGRLFTWVGQGLADYLRKFGLAFLALQVYRSFCTPGLMTQRSFGRFIELLKDRSADQELLEKLRERREQTELAPSERLILGRALLDRGDLDRAQSELAEVYEEWERLDVERKQLLVESLAPVELRRGRASEVLEMFSRFLDEVRANGKLYERVVKIAAGTGDWEVWEKRGREWLEKSRGNYIQSSHRTTLGEAENSDGYQNPESIAGVLTSTYVKNREVDLAKEEFSRLEFLLGLYREQPATENRVSEILEELLRRDLPDHQKREYTRQRAELCERLGEYERAVELYEELTTGEGTDMDLLEKLGHLYRQLERREEAVRCYKNLFDHQQDNAAAIRGLKQLGREYEERDNYAEAEAAYKSVLRNTRSENSEVRYRLGVALYRQGKKEEALSVFQKIKGGGHEFQARVLAFQGRCLVELEMFEVARDKIAEFDYNDPELSARLRHELRYWLARGAEGQGELTPARRHYQNIFASDVEFRDVSKRLERLKNEG